MQNQFTDYVRSQKTLLFVIWGAFLFSNLAFFLMAAFSKRKRFLRALSRPSTDGFGKKMERPCAFSRAPRPSRSR